MRVGPASVKDAIEAVLTAGIGSRDDFYWVLHSVLVTRHEDHAVFDEAFRLFWRDPMGAHAALGLLLPQMKTPTQRTVSRRLSEAWRPPTPGRAPPPAREAPPQVDTFLAYSADEVLRTRDFDQMSADELARCIDRPLPVIV